MESEKYIRYAPRAIGLKPSASQGEARLRGLERIMYSKTISPRLCKAKPACAGATLLVRAEALPEHGEAPAGLARGRSCGLMEIEH